MRMESLSDQDTILPCLAGRSSAHTQQLQQYISNYYSWRARELGPAHSSNNQQIVLQPGTPSSLPPLIEVPGKTETPITTMHKQLDPDSANPTRELRHVPWDPAKASDWCAQMVCYIWFARSSSLPRLRHKRNDASQKGGGIEAEPWPQTCSQQIGFRPHGSVDPVSPLASAGLNMNMTIQHRSQLYPTDRFYEFVKDVLRMTQVSRSVIAFSLLYVYRLKVRHPNLEGQVGSEYRLFLTSLVLANKFLDDHTYTNKTWSDVSKIPLKEITKMELQLWGGIDTNASATPEEYELWQNTLEYLYDQRSLDMRYWASLDTPVLSPSNSTQSDVSNMSANRLNSPARETRTRRAVPSTPDSRGSASVRPSRKRRSSDSSDEPAKKKTTHDYFSDIPRINMLQGSQVPSLRSPNGSMMRPVPRSKPTSDAAVGPTRNLAPPDRIGSGQLLIPGLEPINSVISPSENFLKPELPNIWDMKMSNSSMQGYSGVAPELLLPYETISPFSTPRPDGPSSSPMVFGYYRLAAGYSHGIPAFRCMDPNGNNGDLMFNGLGNLGCSNVEPTLAINSNATVSKPKANYYPPITNETWATSQTALVPWIKSSNPLPLNQALPASCPKPTPMPVHIPMASSVPVSQAILPHHNPMYYYS